MATSTRLEHPRPAPRWQLSPAIAAHWPRDGAWPIPEWLADGRARIVKKGSHRTVLRVELPGISFYLKQHHLPDRATWLRQCIRAPKAKREFDRLVELAKRGVPAPDPLGWGTWGGIGESFVLTRAIDDIKPLHRMIVEDQFAPAERQDLAIALGRFLAKLHQAGVDHRDLHNGNIVVRYQIGESRHGRLTSMVSGISPRMGRPNVTRGDAGLSVAPGASREKAIAPDGATEPPSPHPGRANPLDPVPGAKLSTVSPLATFRRPIRGEMQDTTGLVRSRHGFELFLVDLDAVRLGPPLDRSRSLANLSLFGGAWVLVANRADRLRFLRAYTAERGWIDPARDLAGERELFDLARIIERQAAANNLAFWARRDERCLVANRYYRKIDESPYVGMAVRGADDDWLADLCRDPEAILQQPGLKILKHSKTSTVAEIVAMIDGSPRPAILKKIGATRWSDPFAALVRPTPILRSWIAGQGFLERNLPTPRPLAMIHRRGHGLTYEGYLVTEKLENVQELDAYVASLKTLPKDERRRRLARQIECVARAVRDMHRRHVAHRDLKAANILVTSLAVEDTPAGAPRPICASPFPVPSTNLWFIDLVGVSRHARMSKRRRVQNLTRLNASFLQSPLVTRTDRLRFLRIYLAWGIFAKGDWKAWWRSIAKSTAAKAARNRKSGRALG